MTKMEVGIIILWNKLYLLGRIRMAIIDYKCKKCGKTFFEIVDNLEEKIICPACKSDELERLYKGKYYGKGSGGNCTSGSCAGCSGCH